MGRFVGEDLIGDDIVRENIGLGSRSGRSIGLTVA
jgi:hypothetical protein